MIEKFKKLKYQRAAAQNFCNKKMQVARLFKRHDTYLFGPFEALVLRNCVILMFVNSIQRVVR